MSHHTVGIDLYIMMCKELKYEYYVHIYLMFSLNHSTRYIHFTVYTSVISSSLVIANVNIFTVNYKDSCTQLFNR